MPHMLMRYLPVHTRPLGYVPLVAGVALGLAVDRRLGRDLAIIAVGQGIIYAIPLKADLSDAGILRFAVALSLAVLVPWALSRFAFGATGSVSGTDCAREASDVALSPAFCISATAAAVASSSQ